MGIFQASAGWNAKGMEFGKDPGMTGKGLLRGQKGNRDNETRF